MADYQKLISAIRLSPTRLKRADLAMEMLSDKIRIVNSTSFRRLQTKAQVFSLEDNPAVRSRLTHTLEVAMYGEFLARVIFDQLVEHKLITEGLRFPFAKAVENACLLHDIGNPPFGHLGEYAIRKWFTDHEQQVKNLWHDAGVDEDSIAANISSFTHFDGNAQGMRVVTRLQWLDSQYGLNLTCTLLAAMVKYLGTTPQNVPFGKKAGFFESERRLVERAWDELGMTHHDARLSQRHPLAFLMEAADDIAYGVSDIEDAIEKHIVTEADFFEELLECSAMKEIMALRKLVPESAQGGSHLSSDVRFIWFRIGATRFLIERAADMFVEHHEEILGGSFEESLLKADEPSSKLLDFLRGFTSRHVFLAREAASIELGGYQGIFDILDRFADLLEPERGVFDRLLGGTRLDGGSWAYERRLASLLSRKHIVNYRSQCKESAENELIWRTHLIVDYIAGMTDKHAMNTARMLKGTATTVT